MRRPHDRGGLPAGPINRSGHQLAPWEKRVDALSGLLGRKGLRRTDESRRAMENMDPALYVRLAYYERWVVGMETLLIEKGITTKEEIDRVAGKLGGGAVA